MRPKKDHEIEAMREGGAMLASVLKLLAGKAAIGLTPKDISTLAANELKKLGGEPAFLGFEGYSDVICISVNDQVQHGIPDNRPFKAGDVVNFDFGVRYRGMITDSGVTICIDNEFTDGTKRLIDGTLAALQAGVGVVRAGIKVGDISAAIERVLERFRLGIVEDLVGHGVGYDLHEPPEIPNLGHSGSGPTLAAGLTIAIEPISTLGNPRIVLQPDGWTFKTADGSWSAQFEHTVLVTETGAEILTTTSS